MDHVPPFNFPSHCPSSPATGPPVVSLATTQHRSCCPAGSLSHRGKLRTQGIQATSSHGHCHSSGRALLFLADPANTAPALQSHDLFQQGEHLTWGKISVKVPHFSMGQNLLLPALLPKAHSALSRGGQQGVKAALHMPCQQQKGSASAVTRKAR